MTIPSLDGLRDFSARLGQDFTLTQGAGGNTSLKEGDDLFVKASGKCLRDAHDEDAFACVSLAAARAMPESPPASRNGNRASIETSLHALLPHCVVAHLHAVDVIAAAIRADARAWVDARLGDLAAVLVPYARPGRPLALAVRAAAQGKGDVFVLGNHGLLVGADSFEACAALVETVRQRLASAPRAADASPAQLEATAKRTGLAPAAFAQAHWCALHPDTMRVALAGTLYPDHVVFLGRGAHALTGDAPPPDSPSSLYLVENVGAFLPAAATAAAHEMAACLGMVAARVPADAPVQTLTRAQENELLDWDAEKHRQRLAGAG